MDQAGAAGTWLNLGPRRRRGQVVRQRSAKPSLRALPVLQNRKRNCCFFANIVVGRLARINYPRVNRHSLAPGGLPKIGARWSEEVTASDVNATALKVGVLWKQGMESYPDVAAKWEPKGDIWAFVEGQDGGPVTVADVDAEQLFKQASRLAVSVLEKHTDGVPAHHFWLSSMRDKKRGFRFTIHARNWIAFQAATQALQSGQLLNTNSQGFRLGPDGTIPHVFKEAAEFWEDVWPCGEPQRGVSPHPSDSEAQPANSNRKRGPRTDVHTAQEVRRIVNDVAGAKDWKSEERLTEICDKLDEAQIKRPKSWTGSNNRLQSWSDALINKKDLIIRKIDDHLENAKKSSD